MLEKAAEEIENHFPGVASIGAVGFAYAQSQSFDTGVVVIALKQDILGFIAGNILLSYVSTGNTIQIIGLKEIIIASLGLLLIPKKVQINVADFFAKDLYLPVRCKL